MYDNLSQIHQTRCIIITSLHQTRFMPEGQLVSWTLQRATSVTTCKKLLGFCRDRMCIVASLKIVIIICFSKIIYDNCFSIFQDKKVQIKVKVVYSCVFRPHAFQNNGNQKWKLSWKLSTCSITSRNMLIMCSITRRNILNNIFNNKQKYLQ